MNYHSFNFRQAEEIMNSKKERFDEVKEVVGGLAFRPLQKGDHETIIQAFEKRGWVKEERISQTLEKGWRYDAYRERVAIEVDTSTPCYRSFLKFILGYNLDKIDVGIIVVYDMPEKGKNGAKRFNVTRKELKDLRIIIPVPIFLVGLYP